MIDAPPSKMTEVLEAFDSTEYDQLPPLIKEWANDQGKNLLLQAFHKDNVARVHQLGMTLVFVEDLPEQHRDAMLKESREYGYEIRDGQIVTSDCALFVQSEARRARAEQQAKLQFLAQDLGSLEWAQQELDAVGEGRGGRQYIHAAIPDDAARTLSEHVTGGAIPPNILKPRVPSGRTGRSATNGPVVRRRG